jgi:hypothetical protein
VKKIFRGRGASPVRVALAAVIAVGLAVGLSSCTSRLPIDQAAVVYHGGMHTKDFKHCIAAGKNGDVGANDSEYRYPVNSRDFQFDTDKVSGRERDPITVLAKGGVQMTVTGAVYFTLNDNCEVLQKFHESIGTNYEPGTDGLQKWNDMLAKYIGVPVENALDRVTLDYTMDELIGNAEKKNDWQKRAAEQIVTSIKQVTGGEPYFCKPNYKPNKNDDCGQFSISLNQAQPPAEVAAANADSAAAAKRVATAQSQAAAQAALIKQFGVDGFLELQRLQLLRDMMNNGKITMYPVPTGSSVNITPTK